MSRDSEEYLRRMEEELTEEDDNWLEEAKELMGEEEVPQVSVRNNDRLDVDLDSYSQDVFYS